MLEKKNGAAKIRLFQFNISWDTLICPISYFLSEGSRSSHFIIPREETVMHVTICTSREITPTGNPRESPRKNQEVAF